VSVGQQGNLNEVDNFGGWFLTAKGSMAGDQQALDGCEKTLGKNHPSAVGTVHNMGIV